MDDKYNFDQIGLVFELSITIGDEVSTTGMRSIVVNTPIGNVAAKYLNALARTPQLMIKNQLWAQKSLSIEMQLFTKKKLSMRTQPSTERQESNLSYQNQLATFTIPVYGGF